MLVCKNVNACDGFYLGWRVRAVHGVASLCVPSSVITVVFFFFFFFFFLLFCICMPVCTVIPAWLSADTVLRCYAFIFEIITSPD